jgi:hypothetical protein
MSRIRVGSFYRDCAGHPVLCTEARDGNVTGISLIDGSFPRGCSLQHCVPEKLSLKEALAIKFCEHTFSAEPHFDWSWQICKKCGLSLPGDG